MTSRTNPFRSIYDSSEYRLARIKRTAKAPFIIDVELTNHCNLMCNMCARRIMTRERGFMEKEVWARVLDECIKTGTPIRFIRWGEPFLHRKITDWARKAKEAGLLVHITNNGLVITEIQMHDIVNMGLDSIIFSMQGATKKGYEKMRNNNQYDKLHANILKLIEIRGDNKAPHIHISSTMTDETAEEIEAFKKYWLQFVDSVDIGKTNLARLGGEDGEYIPCNEVYQKLSIDWDGKVTACCGDYDNLLTVGNIMEESLVDIFNGEKLKSIRTILDNKGHKNLALCSKCFMAYGDNF